MEAVPGVARRKLEHNLYLDRAFPDRNFAERQVRAVVGGCLSGEVLVPSAGFLADMDYLQV